MCWQTVELQGLDVGHWPSSLEARNARYCRVRSDIEENLVGRQHARSALIQPHLDRFRRHETPASHDQLGAARLVPFQVHSAQAFDHVALAPPDLCHIDCDWAGDRAECRGAMGEIRYFRAPDLVLAREAVDIGTGAANPAAFHHGSASTGLRHVPGQIIAARPTAEDKRVKPLRFGHGQLRGLVDERRNP